MESNRTEPKPMYDLPELPFEQVLSYLSLEDLIKSRAVSRGWYHRIDSFRVKSLCFSEYPSGFIEGKSRLVSGALAQNFINSRRFASFFNTFGQTILSNLKHLRLCDLRLNAENMPALVQTLQSFGQLEELDLIRFNKKMAVYKPIVPFELVLPMLSSIRLEYTRGVRQLTLDTPRLQKVKLLKCFDSLRLNLVHAKSVERLLIDASAKIEVNQLKNLRYLHVQSSSNIDSTFLSSLEQLKEIHLNYQDYNVSRAFEQTRRYGRTGLKIYRLGVLLNDPEDSVVSHFKFLNYFDEEAFVHLAENPTRLVDEIPLFFRILYFNAIESVDPGSTVNLLNRFTDLNEIYVGRPVQDVHRFLNLLKSLNNLVALCFRCDQPQELFDRLPEHCAVQRLAIEKPSDLRFLFKLKHLMELEVRCSVDIELIRKACEELPFLSLFYFEYCNVQVKIEIGHPKRFRVSIDEEEKEVAVLKAAIQFIIEKLWINI